MESVEQALRPLGQRVSSIIAMALKESSGKLGPNHYRGLETLKKDTGLTRGRKTIFGRKKLCDAG